MQPSLLSVRTVELNDISSIVDYWVNASEEALKRMGANPKKIPSEKKFIEDLTLLCKTPRNQRVTDYLIWEVDGTSIGFSSLKNIVFEKSGEMHLHVWSSKDRGRGHGASLFCQSALDFFQCFNLKQIKCEPSALNPAPNKMLQKIGFPLKRTYLGASSELSLVCELNEYEIQREIAERYLKQECKR